MAHRSAPNAYRLPKVAVPSGSVKVPPCTQSWWLAAWVTCADVSVVVIAPAMDEPVGLPLASRSGTDALVVNGGLTGFDTRDSLVAGSLPLMPLPKVKSHPGSGGAVGLVRRLHRRRDRLARLVGRVRPEVLQALLDVVAGQVGGDVLVRRALPGDEGDQVGARGGGLGRSAGLGDHGQHGGHRGEDDQGDPEGAEAVPGARPGAVVHTADAPIRPHPAEGPVPTAGPTPRRRPSGAAARPGARRSAPGPARSCRGRAP